MSESHALFPGTFDPPTLGHLDLVRRAAAVFGRVTVALADHPTKTPLLGIEERIELLEKCTEGIEGVAVRRLSGLVVDACAELGCDVILRGLRSGGDFEYETQMAGCNRKMLPGIETVFLSSAPELSHISSTLVRQIAAMGGRFDPFVPGPVAAVLRERLRGSG